MGVINVICCKTNKNNLGINENIDTIRLENNSEKNKKKNEISKKEIDKFKIKNCLDILDDSTEEKKNNQKLYQEKKPTKQSEKQNKLNILLNQQNRRKSFQFQ